MLIRSIDSMLSDISCFTACCILCIEVDWNLSPVQFDISHILFSHCFLANGRSSMCNFFIKSRHLLHVIHVMRWNGKYGGWRIGPRQASCFQIVTNPTPALSTSVSTLWHWLRVPIDLFLTCKNGRFTSSLLNFFPLEEMEWKVEYSWAKITKWFRNYSWFYNRKSF